MPSPDTCLTFFGLSVLLGLSPGPDNLFVLLQSTSHGRRAGLLVTLGLCTGLLGHTAAVALGLAAMLSASATGFALLKLAGAAYLLYLAWGAFRTPLDTAQTAVAPAPSPGRMYVRGLLMNLSNPKVALFFLALLPQFIDPQAGPVLAQTLVLGALFMLATLLVFGALAWVASGLGRRLLQSAQAKKALNLLSGVVFTGLAVRLLWSSA